MSFCTSDELDLLVYMLDNMSQMNILEKYTENVEERFDRVNIFSDIAKIMRRMSELRLIYLLKANIIPCLTIYS